VGSEGSVPEGAEIQENSKEKEGSSSSTGTVVAVLCHNYLRCQIASRFVVASRLERTGLEIRGQLETLAHLTASSKLYYYCKPCSYDDPPISGISMPVSASMINRREINDLSYREQNRSPVPESVKGSATPHLKNIQQLTTLLFGVC
jgi:hypothetical protein